MPHRAPRPAPSLAQGPACSLVSGESKGVLVRADADAPWSTWLALYRRGTRPFHAAFAAEPGLPFDRILDVKWGAVDLDPGRRAAWPPSGDYRLTRDADGVLRLPVPDEKLNKVVARITAPADARVGEMLRLVLRVRAAGGFVQFVE